MAYFFNLRSSPEFLQLIFLAKRPLLVLLKVYEHNEKLFTPRSLCTVPFNAVQLWKNDYN